MEGATHAFRRTAPERRSTEGRDGCPTGGRRKAVRRWVRHGRPNGVRRAGVPSEGRGSSGPGRPRFPLLRVAGTPRISGPVVGRRGAFDRLGGAHRSREAFGLRLDDASSPVGRFDRSDLRRAVSTRIPNRARRMRSPDGSWFRSAARRRRSCSQLVVGASAEGRASDRSRRSRAMAGHERFESHGEG